MASSKISEKVSQQLAEWGRRGGSKSTKSKRNAARENIRKALAARYPNNPRWNPPEER
jgi:hypothetical protein